jgi:hypothetical protein
MDVAVEIKRHSPTPNQRQWLRRGLDQPGGKLPLFDQLGQHIDPRTVQACIEQGWAEPWYANPLKPDWLVCKLTPLGRAVAGAKSADRAHAARQLSLVTN